MNQENSLNVEVSICCVVYNHEKYIKQALDSFLMQKTNFSFEIIIHDDASTDGTSLILREYQEKFPDKINLLIQSENQRSKSKNGGMNPRFNFPRAQGKYLAICEGDDYWTDPLKLQKQVDFLEQNPDYTLCCHNVQILDGDKLSDSKLNVKENQNFDLIDLAKGNMMHTPSVMYRRVMKEIPDWFFELPIGDYPLNMLHAEQGKIHYIAENMAVYRHGVGIWSSQKRIGIVEKWIKVLKILIKNIDNNEAKEVMKISLHKHLMEEVSLKNPEIKDLMTASQKVNLPMEMKKTKLLRLLNIIIKVKFISRNA